ncbi:MAG: AAA family ATPase [Chloroflexi bacterium]|nr:AAA family ATPase [Chloroflexota bacterium]
MPVPPLPPEKLHPTVDPVRFTFETTADLSPVIHIIGQPRGVRAIEFGMGMKSRGYNVFIMGPSGTGRATAIERFLQERAANRPTPGDWIYVHNFSTAHQPRAIALDPGEGSVFQARMAALIGRISEDLPQAFESESYEEAIQAVRLAFDTQQAERLMALNAKASGQGLALVRTAGGITVTPVSNGRQLTPEELERLPLAEQETLAKIWKR